jgi:hypothetical protein
MKSFLRKETDELSKELEQLVNLEGNGGGFGDPSAEKQHERKIDLLKHKQLLAVEKSNSRMEKINVIIAILNIGVLIYQVFFAR